MRRFCAGGPWGLLGLLVVLIRGASGCEGNPPHRVSSAPVPEQEVTLGVTAPRPTATPTATSSAARPPRASLRPKTPLWPTPGPATRRRQMAAYSERHYGRSSYL